MNGLARDLVRRLSSLVTLAIALAVVSIGGAGCDSYHYYDMTLQFGNTWTGGINSAGAAQLCKVLVSGADSHEIDFNNCGLNKDNSNYPVVGVFEFATFADSGTLTFTVNAYNGTPPSNCLFGMGMTNETASSTVTTTGTLTINPDGTGCPN